MAKIHSRSKIIPIFTSICKAQCQGKSNVQRNVPNIKELILFSYTLLVVPHNDTFYFVPYVDLGYYLCSVCCFFSEYSNVQFYGKRMKR